jgi:hypothetical protein
VLDGTGAPLADPATTNTSIATAPAAAAPRTTQIDFRMGILHGAR